MSTVSKNVIGKRIVLFVTQTVIDQDINTLLPLPEFQRVRKILKAETLRLLEEAAAL